MQNIPQHGAVMVTLSTDYVFDGRAPPYRPDATPNPLNEYGVSKLHAEQAMLAVLGSDAIVLRVPSALLWSACGSHVLQFCTAARSASTSPPCW